MSPDYVTEEEINRGNPAIKKVFENNKGWVKRSLEKDPEFFSKRAGGQSPTFLYIGCSDSRVPANELTGLEPGELFVHRNIANVVSTNDLSLLSVLQFSVEVLRVPNIIVCGHYGCGGVQAAMKNEDTGMLGNWLKNIREVYLLHKAELDLITDENEKQKRLIELHVGEQCLNIMKTGIVQKARSTTGQPEVHGFVYDINDGHLHKLDIDFDGYMKKYGTIFNLY